MKKFILNLNLLPLIFISCFVSAQQAEDFTATDINGVEHNLFEYLDAGKTVILDVSATWCGPCWGLHQTHRLDYLYQAYGPEGTDEVVVIFYEGDVTTTSDDLNGIGANTLGDWVTGVSYIIIDPETIPAGFLDLYAPEGFPTVSVICPESKEIVADIYNSSYVDMQVEINKCTDLGDVTEGTIAGISGSDKACENLNLAVEIINIGTIALTDFSVIAKQNGEEINSIQVTESIDVEAKYVADLGTLSLVDPETEITYEIVLNDTNSSNNEYTATYSLAPETNNLITVYIEADQYTAEDPTTWKIVDDMGITVVDGPALTPSQTYEGTFELDEINCYSFVMEDGYGDGNSGVINITDSQGNVIHTESAFGSLAESPFSVTSLTVDNEEIDLSTLISVRPTLVDREIIIESNGNINSDAIIEIYNTVGMKMYKKTQSLDGISSIIVTTENFVAGTYLLSVSVDNKVYNTKFVKM